MNIIFWGTPEYSVQSLKKINESNHNVIAVVTQPDKKRGRGNKLIPSKVKEFAKKMNIQVFTPEMIKNNDQFISKIKEFSCDLFIVVAYGKILPKNILEIPRYGSWNAHASLLPRWRGAAPIQWSLLSGDSYTGVGIMKMDEGLDTGDLLIEKKINIDKTDNLETLSQKLSKLSSTLFLEALSIISKSTTSNRKLELIKQQNLKREIIYARMIKKLDYKIDWDNKAIDIFNKVIGLYPLAYTKYKGKNIKILKIQILNTDESNFNEFKISNKEKAGLIIGIIKNKGIVISTKDYPVILLEGKLEGKNISSKNQLIQQLSPIIGEEFRD